MFYEFVNKKGNHVAFNVNSVLFVGERMTANGEVRLSVCFQDGSFQEFTEKYDVFTRELTKRLDVVLLPKNSFILFETRKEERILVQIPLILSLLETDMGVSIIFKDGTEQELPIPYEKVMRRIENHFEIQERNNR